MNERQEIRKQQAMEYARAMEHLGIMKYKYARIFSCIHFFPGSKQTEVAELLDLKQPIISYHIQKMIKNGLIKSYVIKHDRIGQPPKHYVVTDKGRSFVFNMFDQAMREFSRHQDLIKHECMRKHAIPEEHECYH